MISEMINFLAMQCVLVGGILIGLLIAILINQRKNKE